MPRRWLSMRTQKEEPTSTEKPPEGFDFAFGLKPAPADSSLTSQDQKKPFVFGSDSSRVRRKPDLTLLIERPPSSRASSRYNGSHSATRSESSCIGVAFGSPLHPPQNFLYEPNMSPSTHCFLDNSSPNRTPSTKKWKRIRGLFRHGSNSDKAAPLGCHCQQQLDTATHKLGVPIQRTQWRNPRSPSNVQDGFDTYHAIPRTEIYSERPKTSHGHDASSFQKFVDAQPVPSLQVKIPGSPFERYSVMFKNINATPQLTLHNRRSRTMEKLRPEPSPLHENATAGGPGLKRRVTSPTVAKADDTSEPGAKMSSSSRYSLFPSTPTSSRPQSQHRPSNPSFSRPWTAPGLPPPGDSPSPPKRQIQKSTPKPQLKVANVEKDLPSLSPPAIPGIRNFSHHSRGSSNGEIFFDVKSFRDSKGTDVNQYEMTRPPSAELQLARSKSNARKQMQRKSAIMSMHDEVDENSGKSTSAQIDDTIALVESLTSASALAVANTKATETLSPRKIASQHQQARTAVSNDADGVPIDRKKRKSLKPEGLNIDVPSSVLESIEETSPRTVSSRHSIALITEGPAIPRLDRIALRARANSNDTKVSRARLMQDLPFPLPPTVPVKDSKLIPLSKYAPKQTSEDLLRQTGLRPIRPLRSNTDDTASYNHGASVFRRRHPMERSCTMPTVFVSNSANEALAPLALSGRRSSPQLNQEMPMVVAYVKPSAEVSVARTISLSRKASAKIMVSKQASRSTPKLSSHTEEDVTEKKVAERLPVLLEVNNKHKPGLSQNAVLELEGSIPSSPSLTSANDFTKTLDVFPTPPMATM